MMKHRKHHWNCCCLLPSMDRCCTLNTAPILPIIEPLVQSFPVSSHNFFNGHVLLPKRIGEPKIITSWFGSSLFISFIGTVGYRLLRSSTTLIYLDSSITSIETSSASLLIVTLMFVISFVLYAISSTILEVLPYLL